MPRLTHALLIGLMLSCASTAFAQNEAGGSDTAAQNEGGGSDTSAQDEEVGSDTSKLAREFTDPLTTLPQIFIQDAYTPANYGTDAQTNRVIARAIIPRIPSFSLLPFVQLVRPTFQLVTVPTGRGSATRTEFGDMQLFDFAVLPWPGRESGLMMGVGPVFSFRPRRTKPRGRARGKSVPGSGRSTKASRASCWGA